MSTEKLEISHTNTENTESDSVNNKTAKKKKKKKDFDSESTLTAEEKKLRAEQRKRAAKKKRKKRIKMLIIVLVILAALAIVLWRFIKIRQSQEAANTLTTYTVSTRTITEKLSATGTLQPADSYTVTAKVKGDVLEARFEEGDEVEKGAVLYVIDSSDMDSTIRQREINLETAKDNYDDYISNRKELELTSNLNGYVKKLYVEEGDNIAKGQTIADIIDNDSMLIDVPFFEVDVNAMRVGDMITLTIVGSDETVIGYISEISGITGVSAYNVPTREVTVKVNNPGGITKGTTATAIYGNNADISGAQTCEFYYNVEDVLKADYGGEIKTLNLKEGSNVRSGQTIIVFDSEDLDKQIKNADRNLETAQTNYNDAVESKDDYTITAPIKGTVVEKGYNVGESIDVTAGNQTVAIIYDLSSLEFEMSIDELDILSIEKGQEVTVTSDAYAGQTFFGEVTKISKVGSTTSGTTVYPVTVTITDENALEVLLPGMNIDAEIIINKVENVLAVPTGALARGNTVKVIKNKDAVTTPELNGKNGNSENMSNSNAEKKTDIPDMPNMPEMPDGSEMPNQNEHNGEKRFEGITENSKTVYGTAPGDTEYETVKVETGASDDDYIEIVSGLEEGDIVIIEQNQASTSSAMYGMMAMGGGMPDGGMPGGGMGGGMPQGAGNRGGNRGGMQGGR